MIFKEFQKIARLNRDCFITEKIDGTNAQIAILRKEEIYENFPDFTATATREKFIEDFCLGIHPENPHVEDCDKLFMFAGSRTKWITPGKQTDNYGFAQWVKDNNQELFKLGEGKHFGEYWGQGIQRRYGLEEKRFSLFNAVRWSIDPSLKPNCVHLVPVLYIGKFDNEKINEVLKKLETEGSVASPGFMNPEGIVVFHVASRNLYKVTIKDDEKPKSLVKEEECPK